MRFLCLAVGSFGLFGCGLGHSASLDAPDAGATSKPPVGQSDASIAPQTSCSGTGYPIAPCGQKSPPGIAPSPGCSLQSEQCAPTSSCAIDESTCGSASTCLPTATNAGSTSDFRIRRLAIEAPVALASTFVQSAVIDHSIDLKAPQCGETGNGGLNWLLRFDSARSTLTTGGGSIANDPLHAGFCFLQKQVLTFPLAPQTVCTTTANGITQSGVIGSLTLPIFINGQIDNVLLLPLHNVQLSQMQLSADNECIGAFNRNALDSACNVVDDLRCERWHTGGAVAGFITLEEADESEIDDLTESLCVLLTQTSKGPDNKCVRDASGKIASHGDYCSTTHTAGGCADSFWFGATFAASAVTINDGKGDAYCQ